MRSLACSVSASSRSAVAASTSSIRRLVSSRPRSSADCPTSRRITHLQGAAPAPSEPQSLPLDSQELAVDSQELAVRTGGCRMGVLGAGCSSLPPWRLPWNVWPPGAGCQNWWMPNGGARCRMLGGREHHGSRLGVRPTVRVRPHESRRSDGAKSDEAAPTSRIRGSSGSRPGCGRRSATCGPPFSITSPMSSGAESPAADWHVVIDLLDGHGRCSLCFA